MSDYFGLFGSNTNTEGDSNVSGTVNPLFNSSYANNVDNNCALPNPNFVNNSVHNYAAYHSSNVMSYSNYSNYQPHLNVSPASVTNHVVPAHTYQHTMPHHFQTQPNYNQAKHKTNGNNAMRRNLNSSKNNFNNQTNRGERDHNRNHNRFRNSNNLAYKQNGFKQPTANTNVDTSSSLIPSSVDPESTILLNKGPIDPKILHQNQDLTSEGNNEEIDSEEEALDTRLPITENLKNQNVCVSCDNTNCKYRCPSCLLRTCSLDCSKQHKQKYRCTGLHSSLNFKRLSQFDDLQIRSDFHFLESCGRNIESLRRHKRHIVQTLSELPNWLKKLRYEAYVRGVCLKLLPAGFMKRKENKTTYMYAKQEIHWDVEFIFRDLQRSKSELRNELEIKEAEKMTKKRGIRILNHRVPEKTLLLDLLQRYIRPGDLLENQKLNRLLKLYQKSKSNQICVLMRVGKQKHLIVDPTQSLCDILNGKTIVEYPTFVVILSSNLPQYDLITKAELQQDQAKRMTKYSRSNAKSDTTWIAKESAKEMSIEKSEPKQDDTLIETVSQTGDTKPVSLISSVHFSDENSDYSDGEIRDESEDEAGPTEVSIKAVVEQ